MINDANNLEEELYIKYIKFQATPVAGISVNIWKNVEIRRNGNYKLKQKHDIRIDIACDYLRKRLSTLALIVFTLCALHLTMLLRKEFNQYQLEQQ